MSLKLFKMFCLSYIVMGIFHEIIVIIQHLSAPPTEIETIISAMKDIKVFNTNFYNFFVGYDFLTGIYFFIYGYSNYFLASELNQTLFSKKKYHIIIAFVNVLNLYLAITFFFFLPIGFTAFAFISHLSSLFIKDKQ